MLNNFGLVGGFDAILNRISNRDKWCPIECVTNMMLGLGRISFLMHRNFALDFIPKLK